MANQTKADSVYEFISKEIISCRLVPGSKLGISELTERLGVSLGAVREALSRLSSDGLVISEPQKGYSVSPVSRTELADLTKARIAIETLCLQDALTFGDIEWEGRLVSSLHKLNRLPERDPADEHQLNEAWSTAHADFHEALVSSCKNQIFLRMRSTLYSMSERYRHLSVPVARIQRDVANEHKQLLDAALARDFDLTALLMRQHLNKTTTILTSNVPDTLFAKP